MKCFVSMAAFLFYSMAAYAQYTNVLENGTNQIVNTAWTNDTVWVGQTTPSNRLSVVSGGAVFSTNVFVGATSNANDNTVSVTGTGTWDIEDTLEIGTGTNNTVSVGGGGLISVGDLVIHSNNTFNINDGGTFAVSTNLDVSTDGFNWNDGGHLSVGGQLTGMPVSSNTVVLDGERSLTLDGGTWNTASTNLTLDGSDLVVSNGGWVSVGTGTTNDYNMDAAGGIAVGGTNGATLLVDSGSSVQTTGGLYIGGTNAALTGSVSITNGSAVEAESLIIGNAGSELNIDSGGTLSILGTYDAAAQTNVNWHSGGTLSIGGTLNNNAGLGGEGRILRIAGGTWSRAGDISVDGTNNTLSVMAGGTVLNDNGSVGAGVSNLNNTVTVSGEGALWLNNGALSIGSTNGSIGNAVTVTDGGRVEADALLVEGGNSFNLNKDGTLAIAGDFNLSEQTNLSWQGGGLLSLQGELSGLETTSLIVGGATNASAFAYINGGHDIELDGGGGLLDLGTTNLVVGYQASNSELAITDGASVVNADGFIGWGDSSANNSVLVSGAGSTWTNAGGDLYVGAYWSGTNLARANTGNTLTIENGGWVNVGETQSSPTNFAGGSMLVASTNGAQLIVGPGTVDVEGTLYLGLDAATRGTNIIRRGGTVSVGDLLIADGSLLDLQSGGTFAIATNFNVTLQSNVIWNAGGHLSVGGELSGMATTNGSYYLNGGSDLTLDGGTWDISGTNLVVGYNDSGSRLTVKNSGSLSSATAYIGWGTNSANNKVIIEENGMWNSSGDLWVGHEGSFNELTISSGGLVSPTGNAYIGNTNTSDNKVSVSGSNSLWSIGGDLLVGGVSNSTGNSLSVSDQGEVQIDGALTLRSGNSISLASGGTISRLPEMSVYSNSTISGSGTIAFGATNALLAFYGSGISLGTGVVFTADGGFDNEVAVYEGTFTVAGTNEMPYVNFQTLTLSNSTLTGYGLLDAFETVSMVEGVIDPAGDGIGRLEIAGRFLGDGTTNRLQVINDEWDELVFSGTNAVDLNTMSADVFIPYIPDTTNDIVILRGTNLVGSFAETNMDARPLLYNAALYLTSNEVRVVRVPVESGTISSTLDYAAAESVRAGFGGMKNMVFTRTKQLRRNVVSTAHAIPNEVRLLTTTNTPAGAMGPGDQNTIFDMHVWLQHYNGQGNYDRIGLSDGFTLNNNGTTIGADKLIGEALAVGVNYTYARSSALAPGGNRLDTETYWFGAYGEWVGVDGLYFDALAGFGLSRYDSARVAESYLGTASYDGYALGLSADVGQYYYYGEHLALSPYMGLQALSSVAESHEETEAAGSSVEIAEADNTWLESALGLKMRHRFDTPIGRFQTTGYAEWTYDFIQDTISSSISSAGLPATETARIVPDETGINAGLGYSWICTDYLEIGVGYNGRFSDSYEGHSASVMLDIMF